MLTFLFWNLKGNDLRTWSSRKNTLIQHLDTLADHHGIDYLLLAEPGFTISDLSQSLNRNFEILPSNNHRFQILRRSSSPKIQKLFDSLDNRLSIWKLHFGAKSFLLALVHLKDQGNHQIHSLNHATGKIRHELKRQEDLSKLFRTVVVGDFNLNPYDDGLLAANSFHGMMTAELASVGTRVISGESHRLFYNPMWSFFGDRNPGPPGTYFHSTTDEINACWHMFDQVLVSTEMVDELQEVRILDSDGRQTLTTKRGRPRSDTVSDHLPILFCLKLD
ncbi:hypothetical protein KIH39_20250 [Telmatocola sphagniphila]|uniref:Endonuclease/exonuclease/phosphatase domain-containing protein n=1 Tax=Telmatocola sphagniphila TaxID=1123043 RepID=A0A8E6B4F5_9BACT|nr:hypothetical protein [Telmatocola sphagniphila]QVL31157.1 hypothetical protein KIH39_20250 [Telmatocola sphagniphila]